MAGFLEQLRHRREDADYEVNFSWNNATATEAISKAERFVVESDAGSTGTGSQADRGLLEIAPLPPDEGGGHQIEMAAPAVLEQGDLIEVAAAGMVSPAELEQVGFDVVFGDQT